MLRGELSKEEQQVLEDKKAELDDHRQKAVDKAKNLVMEAFDKSDGKTVVFENGGIPWQEALCPTTAEFVVYPSLRGGYNLQCVPPEPRSFDQKVPLPEKWLDKDKMPEGASFVHKGRFLAAFDTKEHAIEAADEAEREMLNKERAIGGFYAMFGDAEHENSGQEFTEQDNHENPANHDGYSLDDDLEL